MNDHRPAPNRHSASGHRHSRHPPPSTSDGRCRTVEHPADLLTVCDDSRDHQHLAYCACLRFTGLANSPGVDDASVRQ